MSYSVPRGPDFIPYALPDVGEEEIDAVARVMRSGWLTTGPETAAFEEEFASYLGGGVTALAVNSATSGLHLALEALGIGPGDEVIAPTLTFTATVEVVRYLGADAVLVDVDPTTLNISPRQFEAAITPRTKAVMVVHYGGLACEMDEVFAIAERHGLAVIEDAAHALPTTWGGRKIGTLASAATVFSFYANKTMTTGEGGMIVTHDTQLIRRMKTMRLHGIDRDAFDRFKSKVPAWYYEVIAPGFKYNMTDVAAATGRVQLRRLEQMAESRQRVADHYLAALADLPLRLPARPPEGELHAWHIFPIRLDGPALELDRDRFIEALAEAGVGTSVHYVPLHRQPYWRDRYELEPQHFPVAEEAYARMISLPIYSGMTLSQVDRVVAAVSRVRMHSTAGLVISPSPRS